MERSPNAVSLFIAKHILKRPSVHESSAVIGPERGPQRWGPFSGNTGRHGDLSTLQPPPQCTYNRMRLRDTHSGIATAAAAAVAETTMASMAAEEATKGTHIQSGDSSESDVPIPTNRVLTDSEIQDRYRHLRFLSPLFSQTTSPTVILLLIFGMAINSGYMIGSGYSLDSAGPEGALVAYSLSTLALYFFITSMAEIASKHGPGTFIFAFGPQIVDSKSLGFGLRWNYLVSWVVTSGYSFITIGTTIEYWMSSRQHAQLFGLAGFAFGFVVIMMFPRAYGKAEIALSVLSLIMIIVSVILGALIINGHIGMDREYGISLWTSYKEQPANYRFIGVVYATIMASFPVQGTEITAMMISGTRNPTRNIRRITITMLIILVVMYTISIFVISLIIPHGDLRMLDDKEETMAYSPFTVMFAQSNIELAADIINVILVIESAFNGCTGMFITSRLLHTYASLGFAPGFLSYSGRRPYLYSVAIALLAAFLCWMPCLFQTSKSLIILSSLASSTGYITWVSIAILHINMRMKSRPEKSSNSKVTYKSTLFPLGPIYILCFIVFIIVGILYSSIVHGISTQGLVILLLGDLIFFTLCVMSKIGTLLGKNKNN